MHQNLWPELKYEDWKDTLTTLHLWTQIVGKIRLRKMPWLNHSWHVTLYVSPCGLTTGSIPFEKGIFQIEFNFQAHQLILTSSTGKNESVGLYPRTVASFYKEVFEKLDQMGISVSIHSSPNEVDPAIAFKHDELPRAYDHEKVTNFWQALLQIHTIFTRFRAGFSGKSSPVHFFWGGFDLAITRFSGKLAPPHQGGMPNMPLNIMQEAYSHEVSSCGFWPGNEVFPYAAFYAYSYPEPALYAKQQVEPEEAFYNEKMGEFLLPYESVRYAVNPQDQIMKFLNSTYEAAANTGLWNRQFLECDFTSFEK